MTAQFVTVQSSFILWRGTLAQTFEADIMYAASQMRSASCSVAMGRVVLERPTEDAKFDGFAILYIHTGVSPTASTGFRMIKDIHLYDKQCDCVRTVSLSAVAAPYFIG